jgi:hypothetical protein
MYPVKVCRPIGVWMWGAARVKAYVLATDPDDVGPDVVALARSVVESAAHQPSSGREVGFVILHRCGPQHLLLACTWRAENELWETVWSDADGTFALLDRSNDHLPTYCVWEMGIVTHETRAWRRALDCGAGAAVLDSYLSDHLVGAV